MSRVLLGTIGVFSIMIGAITAPLFWFLNGLYWIFQPVVTGLLGLTWSFFTLVLAPFLIPLRVLIVIGGFFVGLWEEMSASPPLALPSSPELPIKHSNMSP